MKYVNEKFVILYIMNILNIKSFIWFLCKFIYNFIFTFYFFYVMINSNKKKENT